MKKIILSSILSSFIVLSVLILMGGVPASTVESVSPGVGLDINDNVKFRYGTSQDYEQYFDGTDLLFRRAVGGDIKYEWDATNGVYWKKFYRGPHEWWAQVTSQAAFGSSMGAILLSDPSHDIYTNIYMDDDWDAAGEGDVIVEVWCALESAETANDDINMTVYFDYITEHDTYPGDTKSQTRSVDHDIGNENAQYTVHKMTFVADFDVGGGNSIETADVMGIHIELDSVASTDGCYFLMGVISYRTKYAQPFYGGSMPSEG